jgi:hypothetical protein
MRGSLDGWCVTFSRLGTHANLIIGGGPHIKIWVCADGGGMCSRNMSSEIKPSPYFQFGGGLSKVYHNRSLRYISDYA